MKQVFTAAAALAAVATTAGAGGIDRSGQGLGALFETGRYVELSFGFVAPTVDGTDLLGGATGDVTGNYSQLGFSYKYDVNDKVSFALNLDQPFGADIEYAATSALLGGTVAKTDTYAVTGILRYKFNDAFSVHGGLRAQHAKGNIVLSGAAYAGLSGYNVQFAGDWAPGYLIGVAYEKPEIALRVALTYNSKVKHEFETTQVFFPSGQITEVETPQSVNLDFQTGIAKDTLLFGNIRWADWSAFKIDPVGFPGDGLVSLEDTTTYTLGVGRRFNENWSGSFSLTYEPKGTDKLVSPLAPIDGRYGATMGASYTKDNMKISGGINYSWLGDAQPQTAGAARANVTNNTTIGVGVKVGWSF